MKTSDLVFVGIKGKVVALDRATGVQVWATHLKGIDLVNVVVQTAWCSPCAMVRFSVLTR